MTSIEQDIASWASTRPPWQQAALRQLAQGHSFNETEIKAIAAQLVAGTPPKVQPLKASEVPGAQVAGATVTLESIRDATNVNALLDAQELTLGTSGLTVVYGDNGSGKSGYARLIKDAVDARHHEAVHTNVFADAATGPQKAEITFAAGGTTKTSSWPNAISSELQAISFYDEACGDAYIGGDSELTYRPSVLVMLDGLIAVCDAVRAELDEDLRKNQEARGSLPVLAEGSGSARFLAGISGTTTAAELDAVCSPPSDGSAQLAALIQEEARLRSTDPSAEKQRLQTRAGKVEAIAKHVAALAAALSDEKVKEMLATRDQAAQLRAAANVASTSTFESEPVSGVGTQTWRALWEAAAAFSQAEAYHDQHFPVTSDGARCLLCHQELTPDASNRLERFQAFLQDTTAQQASAAEQALVRTIDGVRTLEPTPPHVAANLTELEADDSVLGQNVSDWLQSSSARKTSVLACLENEPKSTASALAPPPTQELDKRVAELRAKSASIDATQFQTALADAVAKKNALEACILLTDQRASVEAEIARLAQRTKLDEAKRLTDTSGITRKASELTDAHVTSLVRDRFTRESDRLMLERIELKNTGGQKGKLRHRPALLGAKTATPVEQVLSEGEQTALGLAGYFTEAHFDDSKSALVLDDPVTSLDHIRRSHVARRLAQFACDRQVVVFTHDVTFVGNLRQAADSEQVAFTERGVQRRGDKTPGLLTDQHPWKTKDVPRRFDELERELARIKRERATWDQDTYEKECADWAGKLSEAWERIINLEVVYRVVDPGTSEVRPKMFKVLARITEDDDRELQQSYGRISAWARRHDKSPSINYVAPEPAELEQELKFVKTWFERVKKYRS